MSTTLSVNWSVIFFLSGNRLWSQISFMDKAGNWQKMLFTKVVLLELLHVTINTKQGKSSDRVKTFFQDEDTEIQWDWYELNIREGTGYSNQIEASLASEYWYLKCNEGNKMNSISKTIIFIIWFCIKGFVLTDFHRLKSNELLNRKFLITNIQSYYSLTGIFSQILLLVNIKWSKV